jgi:hypothetical protein
VTVNEALAHLATWEHAVRNQANRVLGAAPDSHLGVNIKADGYLLVLALRNVLRAAKLVLVVAPPSAIRAISAAISAFEADVAGAKDARDVLEHFDEYLRGKGNLQPAAGTAMAGTAMYVEWQEWDGSTVRFHFGISTARPLLTVDVLAAQLAAFELRGAIDTAVYEGLMSDVGAAEPLTTPITGRRKIT